MPDLPSFGGVPRAAGDVFCPPARNIYSLDAAWCGWPLFVSADEIDPEEPWEADQGYIRFNGAVNQTGSTELYIRNLSVSWTDMSEILVSLVEGVLIRVHKNGDPTKYLIFRSTGNPIPEDGYHTLLVECTFTTDPSPFEQGDLITISIEMAGAGLTAGTGDSGCCCFEWVFQSLETDVDPGPGNFAFDNEGIGPITEIYVDDSSNTPGVSGAYMLLAVGDQTYDIAGQVRLCKKGDPSIWALFNITGATVDGPGYKKLQVEPVDSSNGLIGDVPFADDDEVIFCFIFGQKILASGLTPGAIQAGASSVALGTVNFSTSNNVSFGLNGSTLTAVALFRLTNAVSSVLATSLAFDNANGFSWLMSTAASGATLSASYTVPTVNNSGLLRISNSVSSVNASQLVFSNANGVTMLLSTNASGATVSGSIASSLTAINLSAGTTSVNASAFTFANAGNVSFGLNGSVITATATIAAPAASSENIIAAGTQTATPGTVLFSNQNNVSFGMSGSSRVTAQAFQLYTNAASSVQATAIQFSNANGVSFLLSTAASGATLSGSIATSLTAVNISAGTTSNNLSAMVFGNANGVTFGLNGSTVTASVGEILGLVSHVGGNSVADVTRLAFQNASNVTFSLSTAAGAATVLASVNAGGLTNINWSGGASSVLASAVTFTNLNNVGFAISTNASGAIVRAAASISVSAGTTSVALSSLQFLDGNGMSFGVAPSGAAAILTADYEKRLRVSHIGGTSGDFTILAFSNASNVTWNISTAASAATIRASVNAGGGVAISADGSSQATGTVSFEAANSLTNVATSPAGNVDFGLSAGTLTAIAGFRVGVNSAGGGIVGTRLAFMNGNRFIWEINNTTNASGRIQTLALSLNRDLAGWSNFRADVNDPEVQFLNPPGVHSGVHVFPLDSPGAGFMEFPGDMTVNTLGVLISNLIASTNHSGSLALTLRMGLYTMVNSTQLSLVNSFSSTYSTGNEATSARVSLYNGPRFFTVHSSVWSSQPVLSASVAYWLAYIWQKAGQATSGNMFVPMMTKQHVGLLNFRGIWNQGLATNSSTWGGFFGPISTTNIPATIGTANLIVYSSGSAGGFSHAYDSRPMIAFAQSHRLMY